MIHRASLSMLAFALAFLSVSCRSESVVQPEGIACFLGPLELPKSEPPVIAPICFTGKSGCPNKPPFGAVAGRPGDVRRWWRSHGEDGVHTES